MKRGLAWFAPVRVDLDVCGKGVDVEFEVREDERGRRQVQQQLVSLRLSVSIVLQSSGFWVWSFGFGPCPSPRCRGTALIRKSAFLGHYSKTLPRDVRWSWGGLPFLMSEAPLYHNRVGIPDDFCRFQGGEIKRAGLQMTFSPPA